MLPQPIESQMRDARRVLIAGAGGGFDFLCGLPLMLSLEAQGIEVHLANLSFTPLQTVNGGIWHGAGLLEVSAQSDGPSYFPEGYLARWFKEKLQRDISLWCFAANGMAPLRENYAYLVERLQIDTVLVVDGGVDSLLRGDEHSLGTPLWDALTLGAVSELDVPRKLLAAVAFGAERWDKIAHAQALHRIADLTHSDALLGVSTLLNATSEGKHFVEAANFIFEQQHEQRPSIVVSALLSALRGEFGERVLNAYTEATPLWISPLLCLYWFFDLGAVAEQKLFLPVLRDTRTLADAAERLQEWMRHQPPQPWERIPI